VDGFFISCKETHLYGQETGDNRLLTSSKVQSCTDSFKLNFQILFFLKVWGAEVLIWVFLKRWQELCLSIKIEKEFTRSMEKTKKGGHFTAPHEVLIYRVKKT